LHATTPERRRAFPGACSEEGKTPVKRQLLAISIALIVPFLTTAYAQAQDPVSMILQAPTDDAYLKHDGTDGDQIFGPQRWSALATSPTTSEC